MEESDEWTPEGATEVEYEATGSAPLPGSAYVGMRRGIHLDNVSGTADL